MCVLVRTNADVREVEEEEEERERDPFNHFLLLDGKIKEAQIKKKGPLLYVCARGEGRDPKADFFHEQPNHDPFFSPPTRPGASANFYTDLLCKFDGALL